MSALQASTTAEPVESHRPHRSRSARIHLLSYTADVTSNDPAALAQLTALFPATTSRPRATGPAPSACFTIVRSGEATANQSYQIRQAEHDLGTFPTAAPAVARLEYQISEEALPNLHAYLLIHAAVVATPAGAIVIPGVTGLGKSTLAAALALAGLTYLSDELAVVDLATREIRPFLKPIRLRDGGWRALTAAGLAPPIHLEATYHDGRTSRYLVAPRRYNATGHIPVQAILLPARQEGVPAHLLPESRARTLAELARHALNLPRHGQSGMASLVRIVEGAACYRLTYDNPRSAINLVSTLVGHQEGGHETGRDAPLGASGRSTS